MHLHNEGSMIRVHCQLIICRGHIRASIDALQIFLFSNLDFVFISAAISKGHPPPAVYMCVGGFRDPKSSNRIELS